MDKNEFRKLMIDIFKMQINAITENPKYEDSEFLQGQEVGLMIAIDKMNSAAFLTEEKTA